MHQMCYMECVCVYVCEREKRERESEQGKQF